MRKHPCEARELDAMIDHGDGPATHRMRDAQCKNRLRQRALFAFAFWSIATISACASRSSHPAETDVSPGLLPTDAVRKTGPDTAEIVRGNSVLCQRDSDIGPPSYRVADLGKPGVPIPPKPDRTTIQAIRVYVKAATLRFSYVGGKLVVFDADRGPCESPPYWVLNGDCNEFYSTSDAFNHTHAADGCYGPPRPWIRHDGGRGKQSWADYEQWK